MEMVDKNALNDFKNLNITRKELEESIGRTQLELSIEDPVEINTADVINLLKGYQSDKITIYELLEWVNTVWFTDLFTYSDDHCDSIASVLNKLEEIDENGYILTDEEIGIYVKTLELNKEL